MSIYSKSFLIILFLSFFTAEIFPESPDPVRARNGMVVSASRLASQVGISILEKGGTAVDAAVAVGFALAVTYPSAGNLGGGGFMVIHSADGKDITIDYREKAPQKSSLSMFLDSAGNYDPLSSQTGGLSSGVPGSVAGLIHALERYGTMQLKDVIQPAIDLAENGFELDYRTAASFRYTLPEFLQYPSSKKIFSKNGQPYEEGDKFIQKDLASTLRLIRDNGVKGFYQGSTAGKIVDEITRTKGIITLEDLINYQPVEREPVTGTYRTYKVISMGPPSSGGVALIQLLNILENFSFTTAEYGGSDYFTKLIEAMKFVYADRSAHLGDEEYYDVPKQWLLSKEYAKIIYNKIANRLSTSDSVYASQSILPGVPGTFSESNETTHYSIMDKYGNAVSTTTTINSSYGSKIVVEGAGFLLNNQMDDFSAGAGVPNQFGLTGSTANSVQPGKRMLSSMTPVMVLKDNYPYLITGSPGGATIITVVLQVLLNSLEFGMDIQKAIDMPRVHHQWYPDSVYAESFGMSPDVRANMINKGYFFGEDRELGRAEGIMIDKINKIIFGATDPRGNGAAIGY